MTLDPYYDCRCGNDGRPDCPIHPNGSPWVGEPLDRPCRSCNAQPGEPCTSATGAVMWPPLVHGRRW